MRQNKLLLTTLRESPGDAEAMSHQLMLRAGFIRQLAAGVYTYLPLGRRVLRKVEQIVREEMDLAHAQEILMPTLQPTELWKESGRYDVYGPELMRLYDRHDREFALGPTHEEVITTLVHNEINSYRKLPITLYQIQTKFRDERRPRYGLLRGREFLMKDAYSFDVDWNGLDQSYWSMFKAYQRIFARCGINFRAVEADAGAIGGEGETHEFMALADIGEDTIAACTSCDYAANLEKAEVGIRSEKNEENIKLDQIAKLYTPNIRTIDELVESLQILPSEIMKTVMFIVDNQVVAVVVRGDHEINEIKVLNYLGAKNITIANSEALEGISSIAVGFIGPYGLDLPVLVDHSVVQMNSGIAGANEFDYHYQNLNPQRDINLEHVGDFRNVTEQDSCPRCSEGIINLHSGIEIGHVFKLGTKYSDKLGAKFLDSSGIAQTMIMGCYGIGVSRVLSAIVEQNHDENGIHWPLSLAPFHVHLLPISVKDDLQIQVANELYERLISHGIEVLMDDRDERAGVKFKDSDLIGIPYRIIIGKDAGEGNIEFVNRRSQAKEMMHIQDVVEHVSVLLKNSH
ncbi:proline--tRNA ligase [Paenibacillus pini]|uniref:Proline--tRNA ligase n=1 Tax=Paenibacillus pini JCM 16418 TaxID=1236976 RepID=W7YGM8_9BACL|nr:proline--tRNA ligase [Paenibacillus pini]GAF07617.1 prolyl-tRNA synthetase [Paenibacillus pini JCM 16418]